MGAGEYIALGGLGFSILSFLLGIYFNRRKAYRAREREKEEEIAAIKVLTHETAKEIKQHKETCEEYKKIQREDIASLQTDFHGRFDNIQKLIQALIKKV